MDQSRLPRIVYICDWDSSLHLNPLAFEVKHVATSFGFDTELNSGDTYYLTSAYSRLLDGSKQRWRLESDHKPKFTTYMYIQIHNFELHQGGSYKVPAQPTDTIKIRYSPY